MQHLDKVPTSSKNVKNLHWGQFSWCQVLFKLLKEKFILIIVKFEQYMHVRDSKALIYSLGRGDGGLLVRILNNYFV